MYCVFKEKVVWGASVVYCSFKVEGHKQHNIQNLATAWKPILVPLEPDCNFRCSQGIKGLSTSGSWLWSEGSILASSHLQLPSTESHLSIFLWHLLHALRPPQLVDRWALQEAVHYFCSILALTRYLSKVYRFIACGIFLTWFHDPTIWRRIDEKMLKSHGKLNVALWELLPNADLMCRFRALSLGFFLPCAWACKAGRLWNKRTQTKYNYVQCT